MTNNPLVPKSIDPSVRGLALRYGGRAFGLMLLYFFVINAVGLQRYEAARFGGHSVLCSGGKREFTLLKVLANELI